MFNLETAVGTQSPRKLLAHLAKQKNVSSPRRVRARIPSPVWVLSHLSGKARGLRILLVWKGRATPPGGMDRRPNRGRYSCANPKVTMTFCISPCTTISYTAVLGPTAVSRMMEKRCKKKSEAGISGPKSLIWLSGENQGSHGNFQGSRSKPCLERRLEIFIVPNYRFLLVSK